MTRHNLYPETICNPDFRRSRTCAVAFSGFWHPAENPVKEILGIARETAKILSSCPRDTERNGSGPAETAKLV